MWHRCGTHANHGEKRLADRRFFWGGKAIASAGEAGCYVVCIGEEEITTRPGEVAEMAEAACGFFRCRGWFGHPIVDRLALL